MSRARVLLARHGIWLVPLLVFTAAGVHEALHASIGYRIGGQPTIGFTMRGQQLGFFDILVRALPSWVLIGILAGIGARVARAFPLQRSTWTRSLPMHLAVSFGAAALCLVAAAAIRHYLFLGPELELSFGFIVLRYYSVYYNSFVLYYWASVGGYSAFAYYRALRERELLAERLAHNLTEARLAMLQTKLQPHFLFNTLNLIASLASEGDRHRTVHTLSQLADLLRLSLSRSEPVVTIAEEIEALELYADIQHTRFEERLAIAIDVEPDCYDAEVPTFLLQPLLENAIRHGVGRGGAGRVCVRCRTSDSHLLVDVEDSGPGFDCAPPVLGTGLRNVTERLRQLYGDAASIRFSPPGSPGGRVTLSWPLRRLERASEIGGGPPVRQAATASLLVTP